MPATVLPDSRTRDRKGGIKVNGIEYVPIYCMFCGDPHGMVPAKLITHVTAVCDPCAETHWAELTNCVDADQKFRSDLEEATADLRTKLGRPVTLAELERIVQEAPSSPIAATIRDWQAHASKENH